MLRLRISAYTLDDATADTLRGAMDNILLARSTLDVAGGGADAAISRYSSGEETPDLLFVQSHGDEASIRTQLEKLSHVVSGGTRVVVLGKVNNIDFYREVLEIGVSYYALEPLTPESYLRALRDVFGDHPSASRGRVLAVTGSKGGVGASTVAHNLAWSLSRRYRRPVSLVDMDLRFGTVSISFNNEHRFGLRDALIEAAGHGSVDGQYLERLFSKESDTLWLLASAPSLSDSTSYLSQEAVEAVLDQVALMSDFVVLDLPHGWDRTLASTLLTADEAIVVTEPSLPGLRNTQMIFDDLSPRRPAGTFLRYVINGTGLSRDTEVVSRDFSEAVGSAPVLTIPWSPGVFRMAAAQGRMPGDMKKVPAIVAGIGEMAGMVSGRPVAARKKTALPDFLAHMAATFRRKPAGQR